MNHSNEIVNYGDLITYYCENLPEYVPSCNTGLALRSRTTANSCEDRFADSGPIEIVFSSKLATSNSEIASLETQISDLKDGGDTESLDDLVGNATEDESLSLRDKLLEESPNLSDTVMVHSVVSETILPTVMLKQILSANPRAAKSGKVLSAIEQRTNRIPTEMLAEIMQGIESHSELELLTDQKNKVVLQKNMLINKRVQTLIQEEQTTTALYNEIATITGTENTSNRMYTAVSAYLSKGNLIDANTTFDNIANLNLTIKEQNEHARLRQIMAIRNSLHSQNKSWFGMSETQLSTIISLSADSSSKSGLEAITIREIISDYEFTPSIEDTDLNSENKSSKVETIYSPFAQLLAKPNPATEYFTVEYTLSEKETIKNCQIKLFSESGVEIQNFKLK